MTANWLCAKNCLQIWNVLLGQVLGLLVLSLYSSNCVRTDSFFILFAVRTLSDNSDADMCVLDAALESIRDAATQLLSDMESDLDEAARREVCIGEIHEELAAIKQLIEVYYSTNQSCVVVHNYVHHIIGRRSHSQDGALSH